MNRYYRPDYRNPRMRTAEPAAAPGTITETTQERACCGSSLAAVYAPRQSFSGLYTPGEALRRGTLFRGLDLPFRGGM